MISKKLIAAVLVALCMISALPLMMPILSLPIDGGYDPWVDTNDDGIINYQDLGHMATIFGTSGTPINKTRLLLELQSSLDSLNDTLVELESTIEALEADVETRIDTLNSTLSNVLPNNETYSATTVDISSYGALFWQDMSDMSVEITLTTDSTLLIMFSAQARVSGSARAIYVRAMVDATSANPANGVTLTQSDEWASHSYTFYILDAAPGTYTVNMQWKLYDELTTGQVGPRTLTVMALPVS